MAKDQPRFSPEDIVFDANLREFADRIGIICGLEQGGQISAIEAYNRIKQVWKELKRSKKGLRIGEDERESR